jgi:CrcB protein
VTFAVWVGVAALGGVGAVLRFLLDGAVQNRAATDLPLGTLAVNVSGSFVLGLLTGLGATGWTLLLAGTAFLGSFTTFSTWVFETHRLGEDGEVGLAFVNVGLSLAAGLAAGAAGWVVGAVL